MKKKGLIITIVVVVFVAVAACFVLPKVLEKERTTSVEYYADMDWDMTLEETYEWAQKNGEEIMEEISKYEMLGYSTFRTERTGFWKYPELAVEILYTSGADYEELDTVSVVMRAQDNANVDEVYDELYQYLEENFEKSKPLGEQSEVIDTTWWTADNADIALMKANIGIMISFYKN